MKQRMTQSRCHSQQVRYVSMARQGKIIVTVEVNCSLSIRVGTLLTKKSLPKGVDLHWKKVKPITTVAHVSLRLYMSRIE